MRDPYRYYVIEHLSRRGGVLVDLPRKSRGLFATLWQQNDEWAGSRRYMSLERLAPGSNTPVIRLPGAAA